MSVLVPGECVRMERSEDVTNPEKKIHFERGPSDMGIWMGVLWPDFKVLHKKNGRDTSSKGWFPTPHHIARF